MLGKIGTFSEIVTRSLGLLVSELGFLNAFLSLEPYAVLKRFSGFCACLCQAHMEDLLKHGLLRCSFGVAGDLRISVSNKFLGDIGAMWVHMYVCETPALKLTPDVILVTTRFSLVCSRLEK